MSQLLAKYNRNQFQSTRPYGARQHKAGKGNKLIAVSIHAPVRGATIYYAGRMSQRVVSIHAPVRGATMFVPDISLLFNVSIHAPVRGATALRLRPRRLIMCFNPRARTGRDYETVHKHGAP